MACFGMRPRVVMRGIGVVAYTAVGASQVLADADELRGRYASLDHEYAAARARYGPWRAYRAPRCRNPFGSSRV